MECWAIEAEEGSRKKRFGLFRRGRSRNKQSEVSIWQRRKKCLLESITPPTSNIPVARCWGSDHKEEEKRRDRGILFWRRRKAQAVKESSPSLGQCVMSEFGSPSEVHAITACLAVLLVAALIKVARKAKIKRKASKTRRSRVKLGPPRELTPLWDHKGHRHDDDRESSRAEHHKIVVDTNSPPSGSVTPKRSRRNSDDAVVCEHLIAAAWEKKKKPYKSTPPVTLVDVPAVVAAEPQDKPPSPYSIERLDQSIKEAFKMNPSDSAMDLVENEVNDPVAPGRRARPRRRSMDGGRTKSMSPVPQREPPQLVRRRNSIGASNHSSPSPETPVSSPDRALSRHNSTRSDLVSSGETRSSVSLGDMSFEQARIRRSNSMGNMSKTSCDDSTLGGESTMSERREFLTIYYASQSGTSAYFANQLQREGLDLGFDVGLRNTRSIGDLLCASDSPAEELRQVLVPHMTKTGKQRGRAVFLVSTWHEGGPTEDAVDFVDILSSLKVNDCLRGLRFAVFGFGDSAYAQTYNLQGKLMDRLLEDLGGKRLLPLALGDERKDSEWEFEEWKWKGFWPTFAELSIKDCQAYQPNVFKNTGGEPSGGEPSVGEPTGESRKPNRLQMPERNSMEVKNTLGDFVLEFVDERFRRKRDDIVGKVHPNSSHFYRGVDCRVKSIKPLWIDASLEAPVDQLGSVVHIEFDLSEDEAGVPPFLYSTGDNVGVMPVNGAEMVERVAEHLGFDLDDTFVLRPLPGGDTSAFAPKVPTPCTVAEYLSLYAELTLTPRRDVIRVLSTFAEDASEREELYQMSKKKNYDKFREWIVEEHLGLADIITRYYPSIRISLADFIQLCTPLQPRWYSASSSSLANPNMLSLTFGVITIPRALDGSFCLGACSHHMANIAVGDSCRVMKLGTSGFVAPLSPRTPLIMVANGTGVAPMRALCQERYHQKKIGLPVGTTKLFFGIRSRELDYLYSDEFQEMKEGGRWFDVAVACSRESKEKVYVQHILEEASEEVWELLQRGGHLYVCGAEEMVSDVDKVLSRLARRKMGRDGAFAEEYIRGLERSKRYVREGWTGKAEA